MQTQSKQKHISCCRQHLRQRINQAFIHLGSLHTLSVRTQNARRVASSSQAIVSPPWWIHQARFDLYICLWSQRYSYSKWGGKERADTTLLKHTHANARTHVQHIPLITHTRTAKLTHTLAHKPTVMHPGSHSCAHTYTRELLLMKFLERQRGKKGRGVKVCKERSPNVFLSVSLTWAFSACFIHSALSAGIWGLRCKHWIYKCFVLFICLPSKPKEATGEEWKWGKRKNECFSRDDDEKETSV